jgi:anti-anti-sigma factor
VNTQQHASVVMICGRLDALTGPDHERHLLHLIENGITRLILDLTALDYISSAGLRVFLTVLKTLERCEGKLCLAGAGTNVTSVLTMSGLDTVLQRRPTVAEARAWIDKGSATTIPGSNEN